MPFGEAKTNRGNESWECGNALQSNNCRRNTLTNIKVARSSENLMQTRQPAGNRLRLKETDSLNRKV